jgi:hypothetical protein
MIPSMSTVTINSDTTDMTIITVLLIGPPPMGGEILGLAVITDVGAKFIDVITCVKSM